MFFHLSLLLAKPRKKRCQETGGCGKLTNMFEASIAEAIIFLPPFSSDKGDSKAAKASVAAVAAVVGAAVAAAAVAAATAVASDGHRFCGPARTCRVVQRENHHEVDGLDQLPLETGHFGYKNFIMEGIDYLVLG